jgi:hypothetical protein
MGLSQAQLGPVDPVLTEHAARSRPTGYIADEVFPPISIPNETGQIQIWDKSNMYTAGTDALRAIGAVAKEPVDPEPSYVDYTCLTFAERLLITQRELRKAGAQGAGAERVRFAKVAKITDQLMLHRELDLSTKLNSTANYDTGLSTTLTNTWLSASGDPVGDIRTGKQALYDVNVFPNKICMDVSVWLALETHPDLLDLTKQTAQGSVSKEQFMKLFGLVPVVGAARYQTGAGVMTPVWGDSAIIFFSPDGQDMNDPMADVTFGRTLMPQEFSFKSYDAPDKDHRGAEYIEGEIAFSHEFIYIDNTTEKDSSAGYLIDNAI